MKSENLTIEQFKDWLTLYGQAWQKQNPDAAARLFSVECAYYETPFAQPLQGREAIRRYWQSGAKESQTDITFSFSAPNIIGLIGYARWSATFTRVSNGKHVQIEGFLEATFEKDGTCDCFREWWHQQET